MNYPLDYRTCTFQGNLDKDGFVCGYASVFDVVDHHGERILKGAFQESLIRHKVHQKTPSMFYNHEPGDSIGLWSVIEEDDHGLWVEGMLDQGKPGFLSLNQHLMAGRYFGLSIGFEIVRFHIDKSVRLIDALDLVEISLVLQPANPLAVFSYYDKTFL